MIMSTKNPVHFQIPVLENNDDNNNNNIISPAEIHQLLSFLQEPAGLLHSPSSSETNRPVYSAEERKRRRKISNRESARRSRFRKKQMHEDLNNELNRLKVVNRELKNRLGFLGHDCYTVQCDSNRLLSESVYLQYKLAGLHQILAQIMPLQY